MIILNLILGLLELTTLIYCPWYFMNNMERTVFRKKRYYICGFAIHAFLLIVGGRGGYSGVLSYVLQPIFLGAMGYFLFHKNKRLVLFDVIYWVVIELVLTGMIRLMLMLASSFAWDMYLFANLAIGLKILATLVITRYILIFFKKRKLSEINSKQLLGTFIFPAASLVLVLIIMKTSEVYTQLYGIAAVVLVAVICVFMNLYFISVIRYMDESRRLERELALYQQQEQLQYKYYEERERKYQESRKVLHDMKNHLQAIESLYEKKEKEAAGEYVKDMHHMLNVLSERYYTDNKMLNIILNEKIPEAERKGIKVSIQIGDENLDWMKDIDLTSIFANLLDNALEAASMVKEDSLFNLKIEKFREFLVIHMKNAKLNVDQKQKPERGDNHHKGLGLQIVRRTVESYDGNIEIEESEKEYQVSITFPLSVK